MVEKWYYKWENKYRDKTESFLADTKPSIICRYKITLVDIFESRVK